MGQSLDNQDQTQNVEKIVKIHVMHETFNWVIRTSGLTPSYEFYVRLSRVLAKRKRDGLRHLL